MAHMADRPDTNRIGLLDLSHTVAADLDISPDEAQHLIETVLNAVTREMTAGRAVTISNFGRFETYTRPEHEGYDPNRRKSTQVPERAYARFRPSETLHAIVRAGDVTAASIRKAPKGQGQGRKRRSA